ncbi:hypothetical protein Pint_25700 [Pistacia integerrima]|uniref:Uncharacterized protein n=1 Tax=Pistacia integerrima TaxID=434235 RepID=A0ACC0YAG6_9ROSI|nr:hypothetical protein Pint_25700 [Pistacia integerrima]
MARNNLGHLFTSISPKLPSPFPIYESICSKVSNSVSRLISLSTQQPQNTRRKPPIKKQETLKANSESQHFW